MTLIDIPQRRTLAEIGLDQFGQSPLRFSGSEINRKSQTMFEAGVPSNFIQDGDIIRRLNLIDGWLQSNGFVSGLTGWRIDSDGNVEFESGYFRGNISGATGTFTGTVTIGSGTAFDPDYNPILKVNTFAQDAVPTSIAVGDLWVDTNDSNKLYRAAIAGADAITAGEWILIRDSDIATALNNAATAISDAATAQGTADGKVTTFLQDAAPTAEGVGDIWIDTNDSNKTYRWSGTLWVEVRDTGIAEAISDAADAQATADGKIVTFYQASVPTSSEAGDLWVDTDDSNKLYRATSAGNTTIAAGQWVSVRDTGIATAISAASDAQATADGKVVTFVQAAAPTAEGTGDLWIDSDDANKLYRWSGAAWVEIRDTGIATALSDAATAQSTADGKIVSFYQDEAPTAEGTGDLWFDTNDNKKPYRWSGSAWVEVPDGNKLNALAGAYASAASGARVLIFPDANTGIQVIDDAAADVFKTVVGGTDVGDVVIGNYAGNQGILYDKSAASTIFKGLVDGATIQTDEIFDKTYGFGGVFVYTHGSDKITSNWSFEVCADNGGLLNVTLNYLDASGNYKLLPGYNTATAKPYYYVYKSAGTYRIYYYAANIYADVAHTYLYFSAFFNSNEAAGW